MQVCVDVVFDHQHTVVFRQLQHLLRHPRRQAAASRVVVEAIDEQSARPVFQQQRFQRCNVRPLRRSWNFEHADTVQPEQIEQHGVTGTFHHHALTRLEQRSHDQVQRLAGTRGRQDLTVLNADIQPLQTLENLPAQGR
ncbi:hypothetical protein D3C87_1374740 [compost metagenome]